MGITEQDLKDQCESIQEDLLCVLDGLDDKILDNVCEVIVDRINILKGRLSKTHQETVVSACKNITREGF